ncbi:hypothetical protein [Tellurirhabdus bombi]|uniref:hypothetical protein n=1 Tax=Tellurirhabdus bombi TaxID=2907205 RepID=UPI001F30F261|nr:hypothetical protein [Tellurirhabdus bombi]
MKTNRLINFLHYIFRTLYGASFFLGILFLIIISPLWSEGLWRWKLSKYVLPTNGSRILHDSAGRSNDMVPWLTLRDKSNSFPYKLLLQDDTYTLLDSNSHVIWEKPEDSLLQEPDSIQQLIASSLLMSKKQQEAEIDSILRVEPEIYIVRTPKRYYKLEPNASSGFQLRMSSGSVPFPNDSRADFMDWDIAPKPWQYTIQQIPNVLVHRDAEFSSGKDYYLHFRYRTWQEFKAS